MLAHKLHHFEHCDFVLLKHGLEGVVAQNLSLIGRVLEVLVLDIGPAGRGGRYEFWEEKRKRRTVRDGELGRRVNQEKGRARRKVNERHLRIYKRQAMVDPLKSETKRNKKGRPHPAGEGQENETVSPKKIPSSRNMLRLTCA